MKNLLIILFISFLPVYVIAQGKWQNEFDKFDQLDQSLDISEGLIVFTGSSSIRKWPDPAKMFSNPDIINRGFGGSEFSDLINHFDQVIGQYNPSQVVIYSGDNDIANGKSVTITFGDFCTLYGIIKTKLPNTQIIVLSIKPSLARWNKADEMKEVNRLMKEFASYREDIEFIDIWTPMIGDNNLPNDELYIEDELHMTDKGYAIWKEALKNHLIQQ